MESSEDDAGAATSASCRASAREKDVGLAEDVDAARNFQHESSETRASCGTPAMSEDNFDGDSVPSPSSKETSTEAILDMIDDFIGDPRAPRLPPQAAVQRVATPPAPSTSDSHHNKQVEDPREQTTVPSREPSPAPVANIVTLSESVHVQPAEAECTPESEIVICVNTSASEGLPQASSSAQVDNDDSGSTQQPEISQNVIPEVSIEEPITAPPSSSVESAQVTLDTSECDSLERTVKCVTSSENRDSVTVELAESTSSECSVSESKALPVEPTMSRSPLKRRLIRPAPSDRRPDSTVSSTADSHIDTHTNEQASDTVAKDVSSSSDAVPIHGVTKPEEISNVSEISICKAETSTVHSRKIKLVRPKGSPVLSNSIRSETQTTSGVIERDRCQSTSSDEISTPSSADVATSSSLIPEKSDEPEKRTLPDISTVEQEHAQTSELTQDVMSNSEPVTTNETVAKETKCTETPQVVEPSINQVPNTLAENQSTVPEVSLGDTHMKDMEKQTSSSILKAEKKVPPITLNLAVTETAMDVTEVQCSSTDLEKPQETHDVKSPSSSLVDQDVLQTPSRNCDQVKLIIKDVNDCDVSKNEKKVPPMKINLTNADHSRNSELPSSVQKSQTAEDGASHKVEDSTKQVPKLTIKLTNKHTEESKSSVPKLTIKPIQPPVEQNPDYHSTQPVPNVTKINIKPIPIPREKVIESVSTPVQQPAEKSSGDCHKSEVIPNVTKIHTKPIPKSKETVNESLSTPIQSTTEQDTDTLNKSKQIPNITKINIKPILKPVETVHASILQPPQPLSVENIVDSDSSKHIPNVVKLNIKPIAKPADKVNESVLQSPQSAKQDPGDAESSKQIQSVTKIIIKPIPKPSEKENETILKPLQPASEQNTDDSNSSKQISNVTKINIKPILKPAEKVIEGVSKALQPTSGQDIEDRHIPNVTKINIKPIQKPTKYGNESVSKSSQSAADQKPECDDTKQQIPSITKINIKPITKPPKKENESILKTQDSKQNIEEQHIPSVTKINIKSIPKPSKNVNDSISRPHLESVQNDITSKNEQMPVITKLNIKPIVKPAEKINEVHRKSSSSEISESECSENDETTSTSDQASASDQGPLISVPKLTIKLGKPGTESEGKFYTEKNIPKLTIKNIQHSDKDDQDSKMKLIVSQSDDKQDKVPKLTIKTVTKSDSQPLSPKLTIKPPQPPRTSKDNEIPKLKISTESISSSAVVKENVHVPKITIKPVTKTDGDGTAKTPKKSTGMYDNSDHIPVVTKLNIKPILKPTESGESSESYDEKVPVVSKLNIKPVIKPKDNEVDSSIEDVPKITKLNIKPIKNPEESSSEKKDCDEKNAEMKDSCIPVVTKLNIKPIVKPVEDEALKDSENQSSETGNSSDENADHIPVVTKLNIKPIIKPSESEEPSKPAHSEQCIPVVTKLNIKPILKPEEQSPGSPKKESSKSSGSTGIPVLTKINIKPVVKPDDLHNKPQEENMEKSSKPPLLMKINMKNVSEISENEHLCNNVAGKAHTPKMAHSPKATKRPVILERNAELSSKSANSSSFDEVVKKSECSRGSPSLLQIECSSSWGHSSDNNIVPEMVHKTVLNSSSKEQSKTVTTEDTVPEHSIQQSKTKSEQPSENKTIKKNAIQTAEVNDKSARISEHFNTNYTKPSILNYTLLKKLLSTTKDIEKTPDTKPSNCISQSEKSEPTLSNCIESKTHEEGQSELLKRLNPKPEIVNDLKHSDSVKMRSIEDVHKEANESVTKPLEIITDKIANESSGQDSPRIILKINKTDQGASAKIITEEIHKPTNSPPSNDTCKSEHAAETVNETASPKKHINSRRKTAAAELAANMTMGKRLRSSRIVESAEKSPIVKRNVNKRPSAAESPGPLQQKESELSIYETKRIKLEELLSANKSLTITPVVSKVSQTSPSKSSVAANQGGKVSHNHSLLNNENSQKNGNSKLQNILSNLQAKQMQTLQLNDTSVTEKPAEVVTEVESGTSTGSSDVVVEITRVENCHLEVQEMIINENSVCDLTGPDDVSQDPLEVESIKTPEEPKEPATVQPIEMTPTPRKRGRPRKLPLPENAKPPMPAPLPVPALEERPQRSLRLMREKPAILRKPRGRGRGRGRGGRRPASPPTASPEPDIKLEPEPETDTVVLIEVEERAPSPIDPTSSRIKLPRMTEALDKSVAGASCATPLSSRRSSSQTDLKLFSSAAVVLESPIKGDEFMKSPEAARPRSGRGSRGGRGRTPRNRGRGRGGGRGAMYMKETMGIYGRVCGPATTTVQLFEEETCMMDDNATPSKPSHLLDEDSQSSVKSSTNDSNKMKKSKFADLFDSNKVWTAADVKEYTWPPPETPNAEPQVMMIQEQVAMFLGVKSFKRRYPELKRRPVGGEEKDYVLGKGLVSEPLCELGITAVDASEVLDIMLSDYPHKYEEYRSHQRQRQNEEVNVEVKVEDRPMKIEIKSEKTSDKPEPPKVDPEKTRQDMAAAAIASAAEWNARANAWRRPACVDLQSNTIHRRRPASGPAPPARVRPPAGFYPHALLPGQFQHWYRTYTAEQLRYFPLNTALAAPPAPPSPPDSSSESEGSWGERSSSSGDEDAPHHHSAKRKKLTRKRSSQQDKEDSNAGVEVETCRVCKLRLEANRKHTHERFLVCANCNAKLHPACVSLPADTIRKCRSYSWQCAECKSCCACSRHQDDDKMLFCDLCDRGFHIYCVGLTAVPSGRWHCVECAICKSCGARDPNGLTPGTGTPGPSTPGPSTPGPSTPGGPGEWHHQTRRGPGGHKVYSHSLCTPCARVR